MKEINFTPETTPTPPTVYPIDATKATLEEMGVLFNALGINASVDEAIKRQRKM